MSSLKDFKELDEIYIYIEENNIDPSAISKLFIKLRDLKAKEDGKKEVEIAQWETDFFYFNIYEGELNCQCSLIDNEGNKIEYPTLKNFNDKTYDYLRERLRKTDNIYIKARYSTILWCSPKKHGEYAKIAFDSFLKLTIIYESKDKKEPQKDWGFNTLQSIKNAYKIGLKSNYKIDIVKSEVIRLINEFNSESKYYFLLKSSLMELMLIEKKNFKKEDFHGFDKVCWEIHRKLVSEDKYDASISILKLGAKIDKKLEINSYEWNKTIAQNYECLMENAIKEKNLVAMDHCLSALKYYKTIKDLDKISELEKKYIEINKAMKLKKVSYELKDYQKHIEQIERLAEDIVESDFLEIIYFLMADNKILLPTFNLLDKLTDDIIKEFPLLGMSSKVDIDDSGHPAVYSVTEEERKHHDIIQQYHLFTSLITNNLLLSLFIKAIITEKLSAIQLINFLKEETWLGRKLIDEYDGRKIVHDWIGLLAPSIFDYFNQIRIHLINPKNPYNFILCTDSLVLKIEGIIRDFCRSNGITTFEYLTDKKSKTVVREKSINKLLFEKKLERILGKDDLLFFKFILIEQGGYNLRNKIAHSLVSINDYNITNIHLLILALFRISKYEIKESE